MRIAVFNRDTGEYGVYKQAREEGWVLYQALCEGRYEPVDGGEPIVAPEYFDKWKRLAEARGETVDGLPLHRITNLPDDFYHPEVLKRRGQHTHGRKDVDVSQLFASDTKADDKPKRGPARAKKERSE